jgi:hypothetical protein
VNRGGQRVRETFIGSQGLGYLLVGGCRRKAEGYERVQPKLRLDGPRVRRMSRDLGDSCRVMARRVGEAWGWGMGIRIILERLSPAERSTVEFRLPNYVGLGRVVLSADLRGTKIFQRLLLLLHAACRCACWRANAKGVLAV